MLKQEFILEKLSVIKKDKQSGFIDLADPLSKMIENAPEESFYKVRMKDSWFTVNFTAMEVGENRLIINAERIQDGFQGDRYVVQFDGTRAAYLVGYYGEGYRTHSCPHIHWDIRSYTDHPDDKDKRIYVNGFRADSELRKMIQKMEERRGTKNIINSYVNDNLIRVRLGLSMGKTLAEIEKEWSKGMMERLGYRHVEALELSHSVVVHWYKTKGDSLLL